MSLLNSFVFDVDWAIIFTVFIEFANIIMLGTASCFNHLHGTSLDDVNRSAIMSVATWMSLVPIRVSRRQLLAINPIPVDCRIEIVSTDPSIFNSYKFETKKV